MSIHSLPTELLHEILSLAVDQQPSSNQYLHQSRGRTLLSLALVHRTWSGVARRIVKEERWIVGYSEQQMKRNATRLVSGRIEEVRVLTIEGDLETLLSETGRERWTGVTHLRIIAERNRTPMGLESFACFPSELYFSIYSLFSLCV